MKKHTTLFFAALFLSLQLITLKLNAQSIQATQVNLINDINTSAPITYRQSNGLGKTTSCGDTIYYPWNKATQFTAITLNATSSGNTFAQWFDADQAITVSGFDFYGWQSAQTNAVVSITCRMYAAGIDSMPTGLPLASVTVPVDSSFGGGQLSAMRRAALFTTAVTTNAPYVITLETASSTNVSIITNAWAPPTGLPNGRSEWLSSVKIGTNFIRGYSVNVGTAIFDADFIFLPYVAYSLTSDFTISSCNTGSNLITFTNTSSPVLFNKFYNFRAFQNITSTTVNYLNYSSNWNYGDSTASRDTILGLKMYNNNAPHTATLRSTIVGWRIGCTDTKSQVVGSAPNAPVAINNGPLCIGATLQLTADSIAGASYYWTGPNGFTSTLRQPTMSGAGILATGNYTVVAIIGACTSSVANTYVSVISSPTATSNGPLCSGQTLNLSATQINGATYAWTGPNSFTSSAAAPSIIGATTTDSGMYSVTISLAGCGLLGPFTTYAPVNKIPASPTPGSNSPLCTGDNLNLTASNYQGAVYTWIGPNNYSSNQQNPSRSSANNTFSGTYSVAITLNGCTSPLVGTTVNVNNIPASPTVGNNGPLCTGQSLSLTATTIANATYSWSGPNGFSSTIQNPVRTSLTTLDAGNYSLTATVNGCTSVAAITNVQITTLTPTPVVSNNGPLCPGQNLQLSASSIPGATYTWNGPNSYTSTLQNPSINNVSTTEAGIYSVTATTSGCGTSSAGNTTLIVNTLPPAPTVSNNGPLCDGATINLTASSVTGATYAWTGVNGFTSTDQNPSITNAAAVKSGDYTVTVTVSGCGTSPSSTTNVKVNRIPARPTATSSGAVCEGDTFKLFSTVSNVGPNVTYSWTGPNSFSSSLKDPIIPAAFSANTGGYSLIITDSNCSSLAASTTATIKLIPAAPTPTSNSPICEGANIILNATAIAGATYSWKGPNGYATTTRNPIIIGATKNAGGAYEVISIVNGCKSVPASTSFLVNESPIKPVVIDSISNCVGATLNLTASSGQGVTYNWTGPDGFLSTQQNPVINNVTLAKAGNYSVIATSSLCASLPGITSVFVNSIPTPPVLSTSPITGEACAGDSIQLFANFVSGALYDWTGPAGFNSNIQRPIIKNLSSANSGQYSATITKSGCTSASSKEISVSVNPVPTTSEINGPAISKVDKIETYSVTGSPTSVYTWLVTGGGIIKSGAGTPSITVNWKSITPNATLKVTETSPSGCVGLQKLLTIDVQENVGLSEVTIKNNIITLFPNPASGTVYLKFNTKKAENTNISIVNILGQEMANYNQTVNVNQNVGVDISTFNSGFYYAVVTIDGETKAIKFTVK